MTTSAPLPPVSAWTASTRSASRELTVSVAPNWRGPASLRAATSTGVVFPPPDLAGVERRAQPGHHAAAEQAGHLGPGRRVDLGALTRRDQGLLGEGADAQGRRQHGAVFQGHLLLGVVGVEAVPGATAQAGPALAADRAPAEDDEIPGLHVGHAVADRFDHPGRLVAEEVGEVVADAALTVVQVGVAHPAGLDLDQGLPRAGVRPHDGGDLDRSALLAGDHTLHALRHRPTPSRGPGRAARPGRGATHHSITYQMDRGAGGGRRTGRRDGADGPGGAMGQTGRVAKKIRVGRTVGMASRARVPGGSGLLAAEEAADGAGGPADGVADGPGG